MESTLKEINERLIYATGLISGIQSAVDDLQKKQESKPEPKFKVGDWVYWRYRGSTMILRITRISGKGDFLWYNNDVFNGERNVMAENLRPATPKEIESHLRKICDEKYIGKKAECLGAFKDINVVDNFYKYYPDSDSMVYRSGFLNVYVYMQGKFAEIIPDKKKLPKTKAEITFFLEEYHRQPLIWEAFLNEYED